MRIAFVGKGGSGKSTITSSFFLRLLEEKKTALLIDADLNIHIPSLLGVELPENKSLSKAINTTAIKTHLRGNSDRIESIKQMYKTTPPSEGVNHFRLRSDDYVLKNYATNIMSTGYLLAVGTYEDQEIGRSCYHTNLAIMENLLTFTCLENDQWIVADMVAGIDAFSNTLHAQFDLIVLIAEPTVEGVSVIEQYKKLSTASGMKNHVVILGNKVMDEDDAAYLAKSAGDIPYLGQIPFSSSLKNDRRKSATLSGEWAKSFLSDELFEAIKTETNEKKYTSEEYWERMFNLHRAYVSQDYVKNAVGDITNQIDSSYRPCIN